MPLRGEELPMPEIDTNASDAINVAESGKEPSPVDDNLPPLGDELGLEVIEGLAEEEQVKTLRPAPAHDQHHEAAAETPVLLNAIEGLSEQLGRRLDMLQMTFERELRAEATRERVVDRLHAELQDYKQDFLLKVQRPIFVDLIQLHDDIGKMIDSRAPVGDGPDRSTDVRGILEPIQTAIEDILYRQGVEPFTLEGTEFDPRKQRAVSTQPTDDQALNKRVAARLRKGFYSGDKLIRPEVVTVFTYRQTSVETST
jgi:molecular chaperone GrpE